MATLDLARNRSMTVYVDNESAAVRRDDLALQRIQNRGIPWLADLT
jgi:hypothetical protein